MSKLFACMLAGTSFVATSATLNVDPEIDLIALNGLAVQSQQLELEAGTYLLQLKYAHLFTMNMKDSGTWVYSTPLFLKVTLADDEQLSVELPPLKNERVANHFVDNPIVTLKSSRHGQQQVRLISESKLLADLFLTQ